MPSRRIRVDQSNSRSRLGGGHPPAPLGTFNQRDTTRSEGGRGTWAGIGEVRLLPNRNFCRRLGPARVSIW
jgi:hypothetical protein